MLRVAIVEDDPAAAMLLQRHIQQFEAEEGVALQCASFPDGVAFLTDYAPVFDIVFLDVEMPFMDGTEVARRLREKDPLVPLVFITNMAQFAIKGYEVNALDYVLKPVSYYRFAALLRKTIRHIRDNSIRQIRIRTPDGFRQIPDIRIRYVGIEDHLLLYHTDDGIIEAWDSLKNAENMLHTESFVRISKSCIVNLRHVREVSGDIVWIGDEARPISRRHKKEFLNAMIHYTGR